MKNRDKQIYDRAKSYLLNLEVEEITEDLIEKYLNPLSIEPRPNTLKKIYFRVLRSAQNANMKASVIGKSINGIENLDKVLFDFDYNKVINNYSSWENILDEIKVKLNPKGKIRETPLSLWPKYCQTILSSAMFIQQFKSSNDFFKWLDFFDKDNRARGSLPMLLSQEIKGFGFALSCDFLKELGYINFPKPDVHLRDIFVGLGLCSKKISDYQLFKAIVLFAKNINVSPYNADKIFWLIGSGFFYNDLHIGKKGKIGSKKKSFIELIKEENI